ncbi:MAG: 2-oxoisovalerate dehydrogenase [Nitrospinae bacterium CG11_big_fil_rev_8_21_14_0_20_56_8]|nr:MAG: 2-oxoisovalerate dehydrogenase [Nitrospinae bacterium CG11_big_fil_rev_8_21_14_0_20_56_8]
MTPERVLQQPAHEGGFETRALGHSIFTEAENAEDLKSMAREAVNCHFGEENRPSIIRLHFVRDEVIPA